MIHWQHMPAQLFMPQRAVYRLAWHVAACTSAAVAGVAHDALQAPKVVDTLVVFKSRKLSSVTYIGCLQQRAGYLG